VKVKTTRGHAAAGLEVARICRAGAFIERWILPLALPECERRRRAERRSSRCMEW